MNPKPAWQSWTVLFNIASIAVTVLSSSDLISILPASAAPKLAAAISILNILLRFKTTQPVTLSFKSPTK